MIRVESFAKTFRTSAFKRPTVAVRSISVEVERGEIHGFLGPNGAGKSTTIKALLGLVRPDGGRLELFGRPVAELGWRARVGYMPEHPSFYDYLSGLELVTWFARLAGMGAHEADRAAKKQLARVGLEHAMTRRIRGYSKGMLQRAGLAQALIGAPELLILDEPMTGLDPIGRRQMRDLILSLQAEGKTVFYSTHILPDIEMTCDRVTIVDQGNTRRTGRLKDILTETTRGVTVEVEGLDGPRLAGARERYPSRAEGTSVIFEVDDPSEASALAAELLGAGGRLVRFEPHRDDLETIFLRSLGAGSGALPERP